MAASADYGGIATVPVLLLKTKSTPSDSYEEILSKEIHPYENLNVRFEPTFVPVLLHRFEESGLGKLRNLLHDRQIGNRTDCKYGGIIFTSQRAVEAFTKVVKEKTDNKNSSHWPHLQDVPIYSVGPATTRALNAVPQEPPLQIFGEHTGNGEALAEYMLEHYAHWYKDRPTLPPLLFLVGEQRRDIIPRSLMSPDLTPSQRIHVDEEVVYGTGVMESFPQDLDSILRRTQSEPLRWIVVFSPTGCDSMLRVMGVLDDKAGSANLDLRDGRTFIATIGPTTKAHLVQNFGINPDVCASAPSPEGVLQAILGFESGKS